jgi:hypothetical protein
MILRYPGGEMDLPSDWLRAFETVQFIDTGREPSEYGMVCCALAMDRMGELAAEMLLHQMKGHRYEPGLLVKVAPRFFTSEQLACKSAGSRAALLDKSRTAGLEAAVEIDQQRSFFVCYQPVPGYSI